MTFNSVFEDRHIPLNKWLFAIHLPVDNESWLESAKTNDSASRWLRGSYGRTTSGQADCGHAAARGAGFEAQEGQETDQETMSKNEALIRDFAGYCAVHPEQRFWQALCNWAEVSAIFVKRQNDSEQIDSFYFEGKQQ